MEAVPWSRGEGGGLCLKMMHLPEIKDQVHKEFWVVYIGVTL